jgi:hypothetical protein
LRHLVHATFAERDRVEGSSFPIASITSRWKARLSSWPEQARGGAQGALQTKCGAVRTVTWHLPAFPT